MGGGGGEGVSARETRKRRRKNRRKRNEDWIDRFCMSMNDERTAKVVRKKSQKSIVEN